MHEEKQFKKVLDNFDQIRNSVMMIENKLENNDWENMEGTFLSSAILADLKQLVLS